jgi:hypothetical protein
MQTLGAVVFSIAAYLKSQLQGVSDRIEGAIFGNDPKTAADRKAFKDFSPFDSSTWDDPNGHWWSAKPKRSGGGDGPVPVYLTNPDHVADHITTGLSNGANAPPTGPTGFDTRLNMLQPGMAVVP